MRVSRTLLVFAALLSLAACGSASGDLLAPGAKTSSQQVADGGLGQIGSGNITSSAMDSTSLGRSAGLMGSGN
ncbi:MAG TPA: hypothetical protein VF263_02370 [Longimicrobiaceae bacterium]